MVQIYNSFSSLDHYFINILFSNFVPMSKIVYGNQNDNE